MNTIMWKSREEDYSFYIHRGCAVGDRAQQGDLFLGQVWIFRWMSLRKEWAQWQEEVRARFPSYGDRSRTVEAEHAGYEAVNIEGGYRMRIWDLSSRFMENDAKEHRRNRKTKEIEHIIKMFVSYQSKTAYQGFEWRHHWSRECDVITSVLSAG